MADQLKFWPYKPEISCSDVDVVQSASDQHYVRCATMFFQQVWGNEVDFEVDSLPSGAFKARVMMGRMVWCSCIHPSKNVAVNAAAKVAVELAMEKASRQHKQQCMQGQQERQARDQTSQLLLARAASKELSRAGSFELLSALLSPMGSLDSLDKYDQAKHGGLQTPEQRLLQQTLLAELLGSMKRSSFSGGC